MRVLVCGSRNWRDRKAVERELRKLPPDAVIIEGEARGADITARDVAKRLGLQVMKFPADWDRYGRAAGPIRNRRMLRVGQPDLVLAFHTNITKSKGTADMVRIARKAGIPVRIFRS